MKKAASILLVLAFVCAMISCKSHHRCAAYGKVEHKQVDKPM